MSNKYENSKDIPNEVICKRLNELAKAVTKGEAGRSEFTMRVPVELDRDADCVLSEASERIAELEAQLAEAAIKEIALKEVCRQVAFSNRYQQKYNGGSAYMTDEEIVYTVLLADAQRKWAEAKAKEG